jgi:chromate transport protein ChrA
MGHTNNEAGAATFQVAMYVLILSYFALFVVPYANLVNVPSLMHAVKSAIACIMFLLVIKLTQKLPNNMTTIFFSCILFTHCQTIFSYSNYR